MFKLLKKLFKPAPEARDVHSHVESVISVMIENVDHAVSEAKQELSELDDALATMMSRRARLAATLSLAEEKQEGIQRVMGITNA